MKAKLALRLRGGEHIALDQVEGARTIHTDLPYANQSPDQVLDLYLPRTGRAPYPVVLYIHAGAFAGGHRRDEQIRPVLGVLRHGYALAALEFRKSDAVTWPAQVYDAKAAVRFLRARAGDYGLDPGRVAAWGASSGAYLACMLGVTGGNPAFEDLSQGHAGYAADVQAVVDWCGCTRFDLIDNQIRANDLGRPFHGEETSPESVMLGAAIAEVADLAHMASPTVYPHRGMPRFLIQHGDRDPVMPVQQSILLAEAIRERAGQDRVVLDIREGGGHHGAVWYETEENVAYILRFLGDALGVDQRGRLEEA